MTTPANVLLLTKDEIVAIGSLLGRPWPTPLSVDGPIDKTSVAQMIGRGETSLLLRELASVSDGCITLCDAVRSFTEQIVAGRYVTVFYGAINNVEQALGGVLHVHSAGDDVILEAAGPLRQLSRLPKPQISDTLRIAARGVFDSGAAGFGADAALHFVHPAGDIARVVTISKRRVTFGERSADAELTITDSSTFWRDGVMAAIESMLSTERPTDN